MNFSIWNCLLKSWIPGNYQHLNCSRFFLTFLVSRVLKQPMFQATSKKAKRKAKQQATSQSQEAQPSEPVEIAKLSTAVDPKMPRRQAEDAFDATAEASKTDRRSSDSASDEPPEGSNSGAGTAALDHDSSKSSSSDEALLSKAAEEDINIGRIMKWHIEWNCSQINAADDLCAHLCNSLLCLEARLSARLLLQHVVADPYTWHPICVGSSIYRATYWIPLCRAISTSLFLNTCHLPPLFASPHTFILCWGKLNIWPTCRQPMSEL